MTERFSELRAMGITHGDDHRRQPAHRGRDREAEAGVDDFLAEATPRTSWR